MTIKSTFSADKLKTFSTAELVYSVVESNGSIKIVGVHSITTPPVEMSPKELAIPNYSKVY